MALAELERHISFLRGMGADANPHSNADLLEHLVGVAALLASWGARAALCRAGLFHSIYGTTAYAAACLPPTQRDALRERIGDEAERLTYLFCAMDRKSFLANKSQPAQTRTILDRFQACAVAVTRQDIADLSHLLAANWLEQRERLGFSHALEGRPQYLQLLPLLSPRARHAFGKLASSPS